MATSKTPPSPLTLLFDSFFFPLMFFLAADAYHSGFSWGQSGNRWSDRVVMALTKGNHSGDALVQSHSN